MPNQAYFYMARRQRKIWFRVDLLTLNEAKMCNKYSRTGELVKDTLMCDFPGEKPNIEGNT